jgi:hypothetical protein
MTIAAAAKCEERPSSVQPTCHCGLLVYVSFVSFGATGGSDSLELVRAHNGSVG